MKKKIVLAASAVVITAGSLFAVSGNPSRIAVAGNFGEQCPPECCVNQNECEELCEESSCCVMGQE